MVANGDGKGRSAGSLDDAAAMRLLSKLYDRDDDLDDVTATSPEPSSPEAIEMAGESVVQAEAGMRELRSVFANMRESMSEEPPSRGLDALLQAARENLASASKTVARHAVVTEPELGFWAKLRRGWMSMLAHPGVMAAAALVVVVGAAGTIYLKTGAVQDDASEQATRNSATTTTSPGPAEAEKARDLSIAGEQAPAAAAGSASNAALRRDDASKEYKPTGDGQQIGTAGNGDKNTKGDASDVSSDGAEGAGRVAVAKPKPAPSTGKKSAVVLEEGKLLKKPGTKALDDLEFQANGGGGAGQGGLAAADEAVTADVAPVSPEPSKQRGRVSSPASPPPAPPPPPPARAAPTTPSAPAPAVQQDNRVFDDARPVVKPQAVPAPTQQPAALLAAAKLAATNGDCARARSLAEQARTTDKRAYDLALKNDATLRACYKP